MPRPSTVMNYNKNMESSKNIKMLRMYAQNKEYRRYKDMMTFEHYIKSKLTRKY